MSTKKQTQATTETKVKKAKKLMPIEDFLAKESEEGEGEEEGAGIIATILKLWVKGYTRKEIRLAGFNKSTVYRQVGEFEKLKKAPVLNHFGYDMYEARLQRVMKAKKMTREEAVTHIATMDIA